MSEILLLINLGKSTVLWTLTVLQSTAPFVRRRHIEVSGLERTPTDIRSPKSLTRLY